MKLLLVATLAASASAFAPQPMNTRTSVAMEAENSRREIFSTLAAGAAAIVPLAANASAGESPRFSVFGLIGDGGSYSEGAAYGSDQAAKLYSPYSVYGNRGGEALYKEGTKAESDRKLAYIAESQKRLSVLPGYVEKKQWFNVKDELTRYMYETRGAVRGLATTPEQKAIAKNFFQAIEETTLQATLKNQEKCAAACADSSKFLADFVASL